MTDSAKMMDDAEIRMRGIEALNKALGVATALRFLALMHHEPTDYVQISRRLYEGQQLDEMFYQGKTKLGGIACIYINKFFLSGIHSRFASST
jgi:hypothetical protein